MESIASTFGSCLMLRVLLVGCLAASLAGCADSERLAQPFSNPFQGDIDRTPTASIAAPTESVQSRPLAPPGGYAAPSYAPSSYREPAYSSERMSSGQSIAGWTAEGGMPVVMAQGESADIIARRYGVPTAALLKTNGFSSSAQVRPGTRLVIPTYNAALAVSSGARLANRGWNRAASPEHLANRALSRSRNGVRLRFVKGPEPANRKFARNANADLKRERMEAAKEPKPERHAGFTRLQPGRSEASARPAPVVAKNDQATRVPIDHMAVASLPPGGNTTMAASPEFRWPAHGRIIQGFRDGGNEGINIALPEGTSVKAAEAGVVTYAGDGLKGYGNLVLIRHPNGFSTVYADNGEIDVKRGDLVRRGQVIAKSGQSGNVASPQLHFELRKGSTPVDPTQHLAGL